MFRKMIEYTIQYTLPATRLIVMGIFIVILLLIYLLVYWERKVNKLYTDIRILLEKNEANLHGK